MEVPPEQIEPLRLRRASSRRDEDGVVRVTDLVEKPAGDEAPSNLAIIGRYVLSTRASSTCCARPRPAAAARSSSPTRCARWPGPAEHGPVHGVVFRGRRYDTGDRLDYLKTVVRLACERDDLGPDFRPGCASSSTRSTWTQCRPAA